jgi:hypothetical protein
MKTHSRSRFPVIAAMMFFCAVGDVAARVITVDPRDSRAFATLAEATSRLKPGDTLVIAPGTGPYREPLHVRVSGTADAPVVVEGNGNEITGFDELVFAPLPDRRMAAAVSVEYPFVLRHNGRRVPEDAATNTFGGGITYDRVAGQLVLAPDVSPQGWEISAREFAVRVSGVSHQIYRDIVATGARNDGFNLHGDGHGLLFESVVGSQNLDEGFSAHGTMQSEIRGGRFFENDNGLVNGFETSTLLRDVDLVNNLGMGLVFNGKARADAGRVRVWGNGMVQVLLRAGIEARFDNIEIYRNANKTRPWVSYMESARWPRPTTLSKDRELVTAGEPLSERLDTAPADVAAW